MGLRGSRPWGCYTANALGLFDMIANAQEWTGDTYAGRVKSPRQRRYGSGGGSVTVAQAGREQCDQGRIIPVRAGLLRALPCFGAGVCRK